jgi:hypothetical protein
MPLSDEAFDRQCRALERMFETGQLKYYSTPKKEEKKIVKPAAGRQKLVPPNFIPQKRRVLLPPAREDKT